MTSSASIPTHNPFAPLSEPTNSSGKYSKADLLAIKNEMPPEDLKKCPSDMPTLKKVKKAAAKTLRNNEERTPKPLRNRVLRHSSRGNFPKPKHAPDATLYNWRK
ncbi:MAG: hypothetical protein COT85_05240 [Chlamydiae bacterium CG10_big_fil_rev_8_21_14_0_10_42_34]|nr:MAG: hypothetical protein COT85_05240 [Chlamydiae bacterium CG10_big_fil_rev_8_21_14_0_10_42_34]